MNLRKRRFRVNRRTMQRAFALMLALLISSASALPTRAQAESGQITVKVTDPQGAAVSGATVTIRSVEQGTTLPVATTSDEGAVTITNLKPGLYEVTVSSQGFANFTQRAQVTTGGKLSVDAKLVVSGGGEVVNVVAGEGGVEVNTQTQE